MIDNKFLEQYVNKSKAMPQRMLVLITYAKTLLAPTVGVGSMWAFVEFVDITSKPVVGIVGTAIIAFFTFLATRATGRTKVEVRQLETTEAANADRASFGLQLFDRATQDIEKARVHFTQELSTQREHFLAELKDARKHYEDRQDEIRQSYHTKNNESSDKMAIYITRLTKIEIQLKSLGIGITDDCELILPSTFERRKPK
jgi:hypothetical protein